MRARRKKKPQQSATPAEYDGYFYLFFPPANKKNIDATKEWARKNNYPVDVCDILPSGACVFRVKDEDFGWLPKEPINKWNEAVRGLCIPDVVHGEGCDPFYPPWSLARCNPVNALTKNWAAINCKNTQGDESEETEQTLAVLERCRQRERPAVSGRTRTRTKRKDTESQGVDDGGHRADPPRRRRRKSSAV